jgi:hypothetical protein
MSNDKLFSVGSFSSYNELKNINISFQVQTSCLVCDPGKHSEKLGTNPISIHKITKRHNQMFRSLNHRKKKGTSFVTQTKMKNI